MSETPNVVPPPPLAGVIPPDELRRIVEEKEEEQQRKRMEGRQKLEQQQKDLHRLFNERHLRPEAGERFSNMVRQAAEHGERRVEILTFPSDWCSDRGRAINNLEPDWPQTLTGIAREVYEAFDRWLRPLGYRMQAQIIDYPGGVPGNVGIYITW